jgi:TolA-binding protein
VSHIPSPMTAQERVEPPPREETGTQAENAPGRDRVNPAPCGETHGLIRIVTDQIEEMRRLLAQMRELQLQESSKRKRTHKARRRREKQRQSKSSVFADAMAGNVPPGTVDHLPVAEANAHSPTDDWIPMGESHGNAEPMVSNLEEVVRTDRYIEDHARNMNIVQR